MRTPRVQDPAPARRLAPALASLLVLTGCGGVGAPPGGSPANRPGESVSSIVSDLRRGAAGASPDFLVGAAGDWRVVAQRAPRRGFRLVPPPGSAHHLLAPRKIYFFSERRRVVLQPVGEAEMAFAFRLPRGMRVLRRKDHPNPPLHFPGPEVWVCREGQAVELEWVGRNQAGWIGPLTAHDSSGRDIPVEGSLTLPAGWVGVPSGSAVFRVGSDRAYGPYSEVRPGLWTADADPYPLAASFVDGIFLDIARLLGPIPGRYPDVVVESCGDCPHPEGTPPIMPAGQGDASVLWVRLGSPGILSDLPGPLYTQPLRPWIPASPRDPLGEALTYLYAQILFPVSPLLGLQFLPPPSLRKPLGEALATYPQDPRNQDSRTLAQRVLPTILFECRSADSAGFDRAVRALLGEHRELTLTGLVQQLRRVAPRCLAPLELRGLLETES